LGILPNAARTVARRCGARPRQSRAAGRRTRSGLPLIIDSFYRDGLDSSRFEVS
jgi:hypothetical protein